MGVVLAEDLSEATRQRLTEFALVLENVEIPMIDSAADEEASRPTCSTWHLGKINSAAARAKGLDGSGVRIGILDTGIDAGHPEFAGRTTSFAEFDTSGFMISTTPRDAGDHGTHVAALVAGHACGVAPAAELAVAAVLTTRTPSGFVGYLAQILAGMNWVAHANHGSAGAPVSQCPVLNASLGSMGYHGYLHASLQVIRQAPAALMVAAIGNEGGKGVNHHGSPGNYDIVVGVGATDSSDSVAAFSDWGIETTHGALKPDLCAPGVRVCSAVPGGAYAMKSGTSMATPQVAGAAALLIQQTPALRRNPAALATRLLSLIDPAPAANPAHTVAGYNRAGTGRLDLAGI